MMISTATDLVAEALFVSDVQPSQSPSAAEVRAAVTRAVLLRGSEGCSAAMAAEFGDHPESAVRRMGWVRDMIRAAYPATAVASALPA